MSSKIFSFFILSSILLVSCLNNNESENLDSNFNIEESEEILEFQGDLGDLEKTLTFELYKTKYTIDIYFENDIIDKLKQSERNLSYYSDQKPENATEMFYNIFLNDESDSYLLEDLLESIRYRNVGTEYDMVELITAFVQSIPYSIAEPQKYPYETLYLNMGDCSDKSVLLCKLLNLEGYDACLFSYKKAEHMSVGIKVNEWPSYYEGYCYIESTAISPIGEIPKELAGGIKIEEEPEIIIPFENGEDTYDEFTELKSFYRHFSQLYGEDYFQTSIKGKKLLEEMNTVSLMVDSINHLQNLVNKELDSLRIAISINGCDSAVGEDKYEDCVSLNNKYNTNVKHFNELNIKSNNLIEIYNQKTQSYNYLKK